ncbi:hypothetical protein ACP70R_023757 [Stipagrostis hirtigluma subsp. patula]
MAAMGTNIQGDAMQCKRCCWIFHRTDAMAPAAGCVLLHRRVAFVDGPARPEAADKQPYAGPAIGDTWEAYIEGIAAYLRAMEPRPQLAEPPMVSHLSMVRPSPSDPSVPQNGRPLSSGYIAAADKNLLVLYAGRYRPASSSSGCYLLYDATSNALATIPPVPRSGHYSSVGRGTVVMAAADGGAFVLAELLAWAPDAMLCLWQHGRWTRRPGRLPAEACPPAHVFGASAAFSAGGRLCCWADLLFGLLLCDVAGDGDPEFRFVPLPDGHAIEIDYRDPHQPSPERFRTMGCVAGAVKFVNIEHGDPQRDRSQLKLTTWILDPARASWSKETELCVGDLWADESFVSRGLPQVVPMFPVLSTQQHDVVYVLLHDFDLVDRHVITRAQHLLSVDTRRNKVLSSTTCTHKNEGHLWLDSLFAAEFSAYIQ